MDDMRVVNISNLTLGSTDDKRIINKVAVKMSMEARLSTWHNVPSVVSRAIRPVIAHLRRNVE